VRPNVSYGPERATLGATCAMLDKMVLSGALWWVMENITKDDPISSDVFFYLRERVRNGD